MSATLLAPTPAPTSPHATLDRAIADLNAHKDAWLNLSIDARLAFIDQLRQRTFAQAETWASLGIQAKGLPPTSNLAGEEFVSGPWPVLHTLNGLDSALRAAQAGTTRQPASLRSRPDGQLVAKVFPLTLSDWIFFSGFKSEVWMEAGVTADNLSQNMGMMYHHKPTQSKVCLVLGAGNVSSIPPMDMLYKLFAEGMVVLLKMNPVNDYLGGVLETVFEPLIQAGFVRFAYGGADVGQYLTQHDGIDEMHITGSARTHDAIVFGTGADGEARKARNEPIMTKRITSELGGVSPVIIVPGDWSDADLRYQAESLVTMRMHNAGCNCVAAQVIVLPEGWSRSEAFLNAVRDVMRSVRRKAYYPGADKRQKTFTSAHPDDAEMLTADSVPNTLITKLDPENPNEVCFIEEAFGNVLGVTYLPAPTPLQFLNNAVQFANEKLMGTLSANILIHPRDIRAMGASFDQAIADLRYGGIGVNCWSAALYLVSQNPWGAFPGHTLNDVGSGIGVVHNTFLFEKPQKAVVYGHFYPYPRNLLHGEWHISPKPSWFVTNKQQLNIGRKVIGFEATKSWWRVPSIIWSAIRG